MGADCLIHATRIGQAQSSGDVAPDTVAAFATLLRDSVPVRVVIAFAFADRGTAIAGTQAVQDGKSLLRKRYDLTAGSAYLFGPDQHVVARWRSLRADTVRRSLGEPS